MQKCLTSDREARPVGGEGKEPEPDAAAILKLDIASGAAGESVYSGIHTGEIGFPGTSGTEGLTSDPSCKPWAGRGAAGDRGGAGKWAGLMPTLTDVLRLQSASLNLCLRLKVGQECSHPLMKKQGTFLSSLSRPHNAAPSQTTLESMAYSLSALGLSPGPQLRAGPWVAKDVHPRMPLPEEQSSSSKCFKWSNVLLLTISYSRLRATQLRWAHSG